MFTGLAEAHSAFAHWNRKANSRAAANKPFCAMPPKLEELTRIFEKGRHFKDDPPTHGRNWGIRSMHGTAAMMPVAYHYFPAARDAGRADD
jgi:hypothetical protein